MAFYWMVTSLLLSVTYGDHVYTNYQVIRVVPLTQRHVLQLHDLAHRDASYHQLDFWTSVRTARKAVDIMVAPTAKKYAKFALEMIGAPYHVIINDVGEVIQAQTRSRISRATGIENENFFEKYHTLDEIRTFTDELLSTYSNVLSEIEIGTSYEGRKLKVLKISGAKQNGKDTIWLQGGVRAREWISPATLMYITDKLLNELESGSGLAIFPFDIYVLFVTNPDGYQYTWDSNRLWRKSRSRNNGSYCVGTDLNTNWPYEWGGQGSSSEPCSEVYRGTHPKSELEVRAVADFLAGLKNFTLFIDFRSYSQYVSYPWGYSENATLIPDEEKMNSGARLIATSIQNVFGTEYLYRTFGTTNTLFQSAGNSEDFAYAIGAQFSYVIELPDRGQYGYLLPEEKIIPTGEETYFGVLDIFGMASERTHSPNNTLHLNYQ